MLQNGADMIVGVVAVGLTVLGHDVQRVDLACPALADGVRDAADKEIRNDARIEAPRPDHDDIGVADGLHALRQGHRTLRDQPDLADAGIVDLFRVEDLALTEHAAAVVKLRLQPHILIGHGQHPAGDGQDVPHPVDRLVKRAGNAVHGRQEQIAEALPGQRAVGKAVVEQLLHGGLGIGQRHDAVADIARRQHPQILAQHAGAAAVVGDGDDGGDILRVGLQAPQHGGQAVPAADGCDARLSAVGLIEPDLFGQFCHRAYLLPISRWLSVAA